MHSLDSKLLKKFLKLAGETLTGDWVLIGGTVLPSLGIDHRVTTDIDLVGLSPQQMTQTLQLMELAEKLGLPVESINQAGAYFFNKVPHTKSDLIELHKGAKATIFRPSATLYLLLKLKRMSESDLLDCLQMVRFASSRKETIDYKRVEKTIQALHKIDPTDDQKRRHFTLLQALES